MVCGRRRTIKYNLYIRSERNNTMSIPACHYSRIHYTSSARFMQTDSHKRCTKQTLNAAFQTDWIFKKIKKNLLVSYSNFSGIIVYGIHEHMKGGIGKISPSSYKCIKLHIHTPCNFIAYTE